VLQKKDSTYEKGKKMLCGSCKTILSDEEEKDEATEYCSVCHKPFCEVCVRISGEFGVYSTICKKCSTQNSWSNFVDQKMRGEK